MRRLVDLSHPIESGMPVYPGLPSPRIEAHISHAASRPTYGGLAEFEISRAFLVGNTGTYLDSPYHRFADGPDVAELPIARLAALPGMCLPAARAGAGPVDVRLPAGLAGFAVLIRSGWSRRWRSRSYWRPGPYLGTALVDALVAARVGLVGVDFWNVDDPRDASRPAHTRLLGAGIPIVEHLTGLTRLPPSGFRFSAVPAPIRGAASFPVRAFAEVPGDGTAADREARGRDDDASAR